MFRRDYSRGCVGEREGGEGDDFLLSDVTHCRYTVTSQVTNPISPVMDCLYTTGRESAASKDLHCTQYFIVQYYLNSRNIISCWRGTNRRNNLGVYRYSQAVCILQFVQRDTKSPLFNYRSTDSSAEKRNNLLPVYTYEIYETRYHKFFSSLADCTSPPSLVTHFTR